MDSSRKKGENLSGSSAAFLDADQMERLAFDKFALGNGEKKEFFVDFRGQAPDNLSRSFWTAKRVQGSVEAMRI